MSVLEVGCGTGLFLRYLHFKGVKRYTAIDSDPTLEEYIHPDVKVNFKSYGMDPDHKDKMRHYGMNSGDAVDGSVYPEFKIL